jgi:translocation and assembly module TamB
MSRRARRRWIIAGSAAALLAALALSAILVLRSGWFREKVRQRIVAEVEKATGGRAEIGAFRFDWKQMRAQVDGLVLHGTEPPDAPPLARCASITLGIKIVSLLKPAVDLEYLDVRRPQINLIVYPDGHTNVPVPKIKRARKSTVATILDLAIGRFTVQEGSFEVQGHGQTPFAASGRNLRAQFTYNLAGARYDGTVSIAPADFQWGRYRPLPLDVSLALALQKNRLQVSSGRLSTGASQAEFSGAIDSLADFSGSFRYNVRVSLAEVSRTLAWRTQLQGPVVLAGGLHFHGTEDYAAAGVLHMDGLLFRPDAHFTLRDLRAEGALTLDSHGLEVTGLRLSGMALAALTGAGRRLEPVPVSGRIEKVVLRGKTLDVTGIRLAQLSGEFAGQARIADFERLHVQGEVRGFDVGKMLRVYNGQAVPWEAAASGPVELEAMLRGAPRLHVASHLAITPAGPGAPVHGSIDVTYDEVSQTVDLGRSFLALPATRVDFSGVLGRELKVHADSRNLAEVLPAFNATSLPVQLQNGEAVFDGAVSGELDAPRIAGHATATGLKWSGRVFDRVAADVDLTGGGLRIGHGSVQRGALRAEGSGSLGMRDWKVEDASPVSAAGSLRHAPASELLAIAGVKDVPLEGTVDADGKISGTLGDPQVTASLAVTHGVLEGEPFDHFTGTLDYSGGAVNMTDARLLAGSRQITFNANYQHQPGDFANGQLRLQVDSNAMPLEQFRAVRQVQGTVEAHGTGLLDLFREKSGKAGLRLVSLTGTLKAMSLRMNGEPLGDATLTATTQGPEIVARLQSDLAGSVIQGEGRWRLADDYPGGAQIQFHQVDLARLRDLLVSGKLARSIQLVGSADGTLAIDGPAAKPELWKATLRVRHFRIAPPSDVNGKNLALANPEPIVISMQRNVVKIESLRLQGRATDLSFSGTVNLQKEDPLDLRVNGRFDLASLQDFNPEIYSEGIVETAAVIRGAIQHPEVNGRMQIQDATFNLVEIPIGIYKANGVIEFDASRATIQSFTAQSGGGEVRISGFAGYTGDALVFRLHAAAHDVRVRYPEDFSTVANASLSLTGTSESSTLAGIITILRTGFNPRSDFSSILAKSAEPVQTPSAQTGLLANMHFDVQIESAPGITFQSSLAEGIQAEANLRLRGTATNPSLLGRINITQGQIVFFGTQFSLNQGSIAFYNPVKIEPVLNVDLETKARGIDVILNISGPINKLNLTPRSDPPLPFSEIVALLATGRSPGSEYATLMTSPASPQSLQQMGASALLGQAIASPVTGRLQRFFGVTRLKIDPTLTSLAGVTYNPGARLTLEQQVTPDVTFTYVTDVTSANPLVVQVEWDVSRHWSVVAVREENGLFGMEFLYKKRFK